jgi:hypothetical protein
MKLNNVTLHEKDAILIIIVKGCMYKRRMKMIDEKALLQSRPEALNDKMDMDLQNQKGGYNNGWNDCLFMFIDRIKKQPKVGEWIPVSERLPEPPRENPELDYCLLDMYLVSINEEGYPVRALWDGKDFGDGMIKLDVKAWMPLPEPYKVREND